MLKLLIELHGEKRICEVFPEIRTEYGNILIKDFRLIEDSLYAPYKNVWVIDYNKEDNYISVMNKKYYTDYTSYEFLNIILPKEDLV